MLKAGGKGPAEETLEVFDSRLWPDESEAAKGMFRLRIGGKWLMDGGRKYTFFTVWGLAVVIAKALVGVLKLGDLDNGKPDLHEGQLVRVYPDPASKETTCGTLRASTRSEPFQTIDGQWRVFVMTQGIVNCDRVQGLDRFGRPLPTVKEEA